MIALRGIALERLRARDAREREAEERKVARLERQTRKSCPRSGTEVGDFDMFLSYIDTNGGPDACHPWLGQTKMNHTDPAVESFAQGSFKIPGIGTQYAHRLICMHTFGVRYISPDTDISPTCKNHLCCNVNHLMARPHGGKAGADHQEAIPVADFFAKTVAKDAGHAELEQAADVLLAA